MKAKPLLIFILILIAAATLSAQPIPSIHLDFSKSDGISITDIAGSTGTHAIQYGKMEKCGSRQALMFDGYLTHVELKKTETMTFDEGITITAWIAPENLKRYTMIVGRPNPKRSWSTPTIGLYFPSPRRVGMGIWTPKKCRLETENEVNAGEWILATCTWDRKMARIYINGELQGEKPCSGKLPELKRSFNIGCGGSSTPYYKGGIGEIRIYESAITPDEIESLYASTQSLYPKKPLQKSDSSTIVVNSKKNATDKWSSFETRTLESLADFNCRAGALTPPPRSRTSATEKDTSNASANLNKYGGWLKKRTKATGFFHAKKIDGRWWLIDPDGCYFIHIGVACVRVGTSPKSKDACEKIYGTRNKWAEGALDLLRKNSFNGIGNWSDYEDLRATAAPMPYTIRGSFLRNFAKLKDLRTKKDGRFGYRGNIPPFFVPGFTEFCAKEAEFYAKYKNDPYLVGVFSDNEIIPAHLDRFLALDQSNPLLKPSYDAAMNWLKQQRGTDSVDPESITRLEQLEFGAYAFEQYYKIISEALNKVLPNHMYLGSRINSPTYTNPFVVKACGKYADVVSINYYNAWNPDPVGYWEEISGKPMMITEFYTKGEDTGMPNNTGAGWIVPTQADRGHFYQNFILGLLESKGCVGWHWFKYMDNDPDNKKADPSNIDSNKGIIKVDFKPYPELLNAMKEINQEVYPLTGYFDSKQKVSESQILHFERQNN